MRIPEVGEVLTVGLPSEVTRAEVQAVEDKDTVIATLNQSRPFSKFHDYRYEDWVRAKRVEGLVPGISKWEVVGTVAKPAPRAVAAEPEPAGKRRERKVK
jgi:hypothetical protein